ncbi:MAG: hypothetical protein P8Z73_10470 [Desulfobacteraceae bacterium]
MKFVQIKRICSYEKGLYFKEREFKGVLEQGCHWFVDLFNKVCIDVQDQRTPWLEHEDLDIIVQSGVLQDQAEVLDLKDHQRALVWIDGRFDRVLGPGLYALWTACRKVRTQVVDAGEVRFEHQAINAIAKSSNVADQLNMVTVDEGFAGVYF